MNKFSYKENEGLFFGGKLIVESCRQLRIFHLDTMIDINNKLIDTFPNLAEEYERIFNKEKITNLEVDIENLILQVIPEKDNIFTVANDAITNWESSSINTDIVYHINKTKITQLELNEAIYGYSLILKVLLPVILVKIITQEIKAGAASLAIKNELHKAFKTATTMVGEPEFYNLLTSFMEKKITGKNTDENKLVLSSPEVRSVIELDVIGAALVKASLLNGTKVSPAGFLSVCAKSSLRFRLNSNLK